MHWLRQAVTPGGANQLSRMQAQSFVLPESTQGATSRTPALQGRRLVMRDNVHLFDPGAEHHEVLATEGTAATSQGDSTLTFSASTCSRSSHSLQAGRHTWSLQL